MRTTFCISIPGNVNTVVPKTHCVNNGVVNTLQQKSVNDFRKKGTLYKNHSCKINNSLKFTVRRRPQSQYGKLSKSLLVPILSINL